ncbi:hypothetical protein A5622_16975 [Mycobacterium sp. 1245801.1]|nr:hypothetical protein A5622_16975 [Mycobacterium sp. 1245801.1]
MVPDPRRQLGDGIGQLEARRVGLGWIGIGPVRRVRLVRARRFLWLDAVPQRGGRGIGGGLRRRCREVVSIRRWERTGVFDAQLRRTLARVQPFTGRASAMFACRTWRRNHAIV